MKRAISLLMLVLTSLILSLIIIVGSILWAMFSTTGDQERTEALFGAVFFETRPTAEGNVAATMGVANFAITGALFAGIFAFCALVAFFIRRLKRYRASLLAESGGPDSSSRITA